MWFFWLDFIPRNLIHTNPCVCNLCLNQLILWINTILTILHDTMGKTIYNHMFNYKWLPSISSYKCNFVLWLLHNLDEKKRWKMSSCHPHMVASYDRWQLSYLFNYNFYFLDHTWCLVKFILQLHIIITNVCVHGLLMYVICCVNSNNDGVNFQSTTNYTWWKHGKVDHCIKWKVAIK